MTTAPLSRNVNVLREFLKIAVQLSQVEAQAVNSSQLYRGWDADEIWSFISGVSRANIKRTLWGDSTVNICVAPQASDSPFCIISMSPADSLYRPWCEICQLLALPKEEILAKAAQFHENTYDRKTADAPFLNKALKNPENIEAIYTQDFTRLYDDFRVPTYSPVGQTFPTNAEKRSVVFLETKGRPYVVLDTDDPLLARDTCAMLNQLSLSRRSRGYQPSETTEVPFFRSLDEFHQSTQSKSSHAYVPNNWEIPF